MFSKNFVAPGRANISKLFKVARITTIGKYKGRMKKRNTLNLVDSTTASCGEPVACTLMRSGDSNAPIMQTAVTTAVPPVMIRLI